MTVSRTLLSLSISAFAWCQSTPTARELFFNDGPATPARAAAPKPASVPKPKPVKRASQADPITQSKPAQVTAPTLPEAPEAPGNPQIITVAQHSGGPVGKPLGLRYSLAKLNASGGYDEVDSQSVFHSGEAVRVNIEANDSGYLYVISQGTSGTWKPEFPSPDVDQGSNWIEKGHQYTVPPGSHFRFYGQSGEEKLFVVLSRKPEPSLEQLIYSIGAPGAPKGTAAPTPVQDKPSLKVMMASAAPINDGTVGELRNVYSRDLMVEKIDGASNGRAQEKAVYVVNASGSADSRVVADIRLTHQ